MHRKDSQDVTVPLQFELTVLIMEDRYDSDLHDEVSALRKHSNQGETRTAIQV